MKLTICGFDEELQRRIVELARSRNLSFSRAALELMRKGAGLLEGRAHHDVVRDHLDDFIGSWSETRERELLDAIAGFERIDDA